MTWHIVSFAKMNLTEISSMLNEHPETSVEKGVFKCFVVSFFTHLSAFI